MLQTRNRNCECDNDEDSRRGLSKSKRKKIKKEDDEEDNDFANMSPEKQEQYSIILNDINKKLHVVMWKPDS